MSELTEIVKEMMSLKEQLENCRQRLVKYVVANKISQTGLAKKIEIYGKLPWKVAQAEALRVTRHSER